MAVISQHSVHLWVSNCVTFYCEPIAVAKLMQVVWHVYQLPYMEVLGHMFKAWIRLPAVHVVFGHDLIKVLFSMPTVKVAAFHVSTMMLLELNRSGTGCSLLFFLALERSRRLHMTYGHMVYVYSHARHLFQSHPWVVLHLTFAVECYSSVSAWKLKQDFSWKREKHLLPLESCSLQFNIL